MTEEAQLRVAAAQIACTLGDVRANVRKHLDVIEEARAAGVDLLVFPEMSLTGHSAGAQTLRLAIERDSPVIADIARASGPMCTVFGFIEHGDAAQHYNAAAAVRDGALLAVHRKINLATYGRLDDGKHFGAGSHVDVFALARRWSASMLICADTWNPALVHLAAMQGCTLLALPISSGLEAVGSDFDNPGGWDINARFHALTYGLPIVLANRVGRENDLTFWGGSRVVDPFGRTLAIADRDGEALVHAELDFDDVRRARYQLPTVRDANLALVAREIDRVMRERGLAR